MTDLLPFLDAAVCPWLAADTVCARLAAAGATALDLAAPRWSLAPGQRAYIRRGAAVIALAAGTSPARVLGLGAHLDSPHLRLKPQAAFASERVYQLAIEPYGSAILASWLDRDLGLAGVVHTRGGARSVRLAEPIARIPHLAIHLDRTVNDGLKLNPHQHLNPVWGLGDDARGAFAERLARAADCAVGDLRAADLSLYDLAPAVRAGADGAFISSGRLDNLASCHAALAAFLATPPRTGVLTVVAWFDHEEVGSASGSGADGALLGQVLERAALALGLDRAALLAALAGGTLLSADMAHALHPNYADKHDPRHAPRLGGGVVMKRNANQRYATSAAGVALVAGLAADAGIALQDFSARADLGCGSTIGPACAAALGLEVIDLGAPLLGMHSARELMAASDHAATIGLLTAYLAAG